MVNKDFLANIKNEVSNPDALKFIEVLGFNDINILLINKISYYISLLHCV